MSPQAQQIIERFGNARRLAKAIGVGPASVYRWTYAKDRGGSGGIIPGRCVPKVKAAAAAAGIVLTDADWAP